MKEKHSFQKQMSLIYSDFKSDESTISHTNKYTEVPNEDT